MRVRLILIAVTFALIASVPATAQTPDGETPAVETICDELIGYTPGLYGLCVAYCEAHDAHMLLPSGNPAELDVPNRMILEIYNKKMTPDDPPMPCLKPDESPDEPQVICPCWSADELSTVWPPSDNIDSNYAHACKNSDNSAILVNYENGEEVVPWIRIEAYYFGEFENSCAVDNMGYAGGPSSDFVWPISEDEFQACKSLVAARANAVTDGTVWSCFTGE